MCVCPTPFWEIYSKFVLKKFENKMVLCVLDKEFNLVITKSWMHIVNASWRSEPLSRQRLHASPFQEEGDACTYKARSSSALEEDCTFGVWLEYESILRKLPRVSESPPILGFFLKCDWSPDSIWFYYRS